MALLLLLAAAVLGANAESAAVGHVVEDGEATPAARFTPNIQPAFTIERAAEKPRIDGRLDDSVWRSARRLGNFCEIRPGDNIKPAVNTEVMFTYDQENLYVAFVCHDDPAGIRASVSDRDGIVDDDRIGIIIDTFRDQQTAYEFIVNPYGIQADARRTGDEEDLSYDAVWYTGGNITGNGWTAEMSIPFRSIRFPDASSQDWGLHIIRTRLRESREKYSWALISRDETCMLCVAGTMQGLAGINQRRNLEILPYTIGTQAGYLEVPDDPNSAFVEEPGDADAGLGVKYGITPSYTMDFAYNPDFSQIESDAAQIDANTTFALFFPERRPFFQEGADIFSTMINAVHTRSINDPIVAGKVTGKSGRTAIGYLAARDQATPYVVPFEESSQLAVGGRSYSNILRVKRDILEDSFIGILATDRRAETSGGSNTSVGVDGGIRILENYRLRWQFQISHTKEPNDEELSEDFENIRFGDQGRHDSLFNGEEFVGHAAEVSLGREARHWSFRTWYNDYSPTFRADNGFVTANNHRLARFWTGYTFYTDEGRFTELIQPQLHGGVEYNYDHQLKDEWIVPAIRVEFRRQTSICLGNVFARKRYANVLVDGVRWTKCDISTTFSGFLSADIGAEVGPALVRDADWPRLGFQRLLKFQATLKPTPQLCVDMELQGLRMTELENRLQNGRQIVKGDEIYDVYIGRAQLSYQFTNNLFFRVVTQYVDSDELIEVDPLISFKLNPFTVFFLGSSHSFCQLDSDASGNCRTYRQTDRTYFVKFQYLLRL